MAVSSLKGKDYWLLTAVMAVMAAVIALFAFCSVASLRHILLSVTILYAAFLCISALLLYRFLPKRGCWIFRGIVVLLLVFSFGKLLHLNPYRSLAADFAAVIQKESGTAASPIILTFDKRAEQYRHYSTLPVASAIQRIGSPNSVLDTYLSALIWNHDRVYVIWEMMADQNYVPPEPSSPFFPGCGEWEKIAESYTTRKRNKKRYLYRYTFSEAIRKKNVENPKRFDTEQFVWGDMERGGNTPPHYCPLLGKERGIPFFQTSSQFFPAGIELWTHRYWQPQSDSKIFLDERNAIAGKRSLYCASRSPVRWFVGKWLPRQDIVVSFDIMCKETAKFQFVVNGQWNGGFYQRELPFGESLTGSGKTEHYVFHLTRDFLAPADTVKIGFNLASGECVIDNFSIRTASQN